ncbi:MAG: DUF3631 domain-containing protein, partial [Sulfuricaulis sp.]
MTADRCIVIRMQRKTPTEKCDRLRNLETTALTTQCARFVAAHAPAIAAARPDLPTSLNDRAADIWEPLLALADLARGVWPDKARQAAVALSASAQEDSPIGSLLLDIFLFFLAGRTDRLFSRTLVEGLNDLPDRPWAEMLHGKEITEIWLAQRLRPYAVHPRSTRIDDTVAKGYWRDDFRKVFQRYIPHSELEALKAQWR